MSKVTEVDVKVGVDAYKTAAWRFDQPPVLPEGIKAALESYAIAQEPRPMHEPVSDAEASAMAKEYWHNTERGADERTIDRLAMKEAGNALLARRAAATRVEIVRDGAQSYSIEPEDKPIAELLAKLDARKS